MKLFYFTVHPWNPSVRCRTDFMDTYWVSATCFTRLTYWSVTQLMCLNSRMTRSPPFLSVRFLTVNPSGRLFHSLSIAIVSSVVPVSRLLLSASVRGWWPTCDVTVFSRSCTDQWLKISGNSVSSSFHIVFRVFSPLMQMNHHLEDARRTNSVWTIHQHRWCVSVCNSERSSHWCCMCPRVWIGRSSSVLNLPSVIRRVLQRSHLFDSLPLVILFRQ